MIVASVVFNVVVYFMQVLIQISLRVTQNTGTTLFLCLQGTCWLLVVCTVEPGHPWGTKFGPYVGVAFIEGCFVHKLIIWDLDSWLLYSFGNLANKGAGVAKPRLTQSSQYNARDTIMLCNAIMQHDSQSLLIRQIKFEL